MCGIAGSAGLARADTDTMELVERMLTSLAHRGPDDQYAVRLGSTVLGARRLSIIDLETGRQPLANEDGSIWATQNGEIYNYVELRQDLERRGHPFRTNGDTEAIVHLYEEYGDSFVDHLRGMFAIAVWDAREERLVLARDRLGKKPLYWHNDGERLIYGSELKAILQDPRVPRTVDRTALAQYLEYQYVPSPRSIILGVSKLLPAGVLSWHRGEVRVRRYWAPPYEPKRDASVEADREECLELLRESVRLRLRSDVPVGAFLSGGVDSSVVVALMAEASPEPVRTYSIGFDEPGFNELPYARTIAERFGTRHTEDVVRLDAIGLLPELADHYDEPFADSSAIPTFRVAQLAARELKVVLTGDGGDEAFGGYDRYRFQLGMNVLGRLPPRIHEAVAAGAQALLARSRQGARLRRRAESWGRLAGLSADQRYVSLMSIFGPELRQELLRDATWDQDSYLLKVLEAGPHGGIDRLLHADTTSYLPEDLLVKMDRATMANSLEARAPLLDHRLVEFAGRLRTDRKLRRMTGKAILRDVARGLLPPGHLDRPKMGFGIPVGAWFRTELGDRYRDLVMASDAGSRDLVDQRVASRLLDEHRAGVADHGPRLWSLLMLELWTRTWMSSRIAVAA